MLAGPIWLGDNSSVMKRCIERLYATSSQLNPAGQYAYYGRVAGCLITGNEDGIKHCAMNILYSLQHLGYAIPPQADAGWIGEAGPGPSYLDPGSGGPENDFTNRNTTFMTWNLMHLAQLLSTAGGFPVQGNQRSAWDDGRRFDWENPEYRYRSAPTPGFLLRQWKAHRQARAEPARRVARVHAAGQLERKAQPQAQPAIGAGSADAPALVAHAHEQLALLDVSAQLERRIGRLLAVVGVQHDVCAGLGHDQLDVVDERRRQPVELAELRHGASRDRHLIRFRGETQDEAVHLAGLAVARAHASPTPSTRAAALVPSACDLSVGMPTQGRSKHPAGPRGTRLAAGVTLAHACAVILEHPPA